LSSWEEPIKDAGFAFHGWVTLLGIAAALWHARAFEADNLNTVGTTDALNDDPNINRTIQVKRLAIGFTPDQHIRGSKSLLHERVHGVVWLAVNDDREAVPVPLQSPVRIQPRDHGPGFGMTAIFRDFTHKEAAEIAGLGTAGQQHGDSHDAGEKSAFHGIFSGHNPKGDGNDFNGIPLNIHGGSMARRGGGGKREKWVAGVPLNPALPGGVTMNLGSPPGMKPRKWR
jgi:hypothetical protein